MPKVARPSNKQDVYFKQAYTKSSIKCKEESTLIASAWKPTIPERTVVDVMFRREDDRLVINYHGYLYRIWESQIIPV